MYHLMLIYYVSFEVSNFYIDTNFSLSSKTGRHISFSYVSYVNYLLTGPELFLISFSPVRKKQLNH